MKTRKLLTQYLAFQRLFFQVGISLKCPMILVILLVMLSCSLFHQESPQLEDDLNQRQTSEISTPPQVSEVSIPITINQDKIPQSVVMPQTNFPNQLVHESTHVFWREEVPPLIRGLGHLVSENNMIWAIASEGVAIRMPNPEYTWEDIWKLDTPENSDLAHDAVTDIALDKFGGVWATTWWGISHFSDDTWKTFNSDGDLQGNVFCVAVDSNDMAWFGGPAGAASFDGNRWTFYNTDDGLPDNTVLDIAVGSDDEVWFITKYGGLARLFNGRWDNFETPFDLSDDRSSPRLLVDHNSTVWLATSYGLASFDGKSWQNWTNIPVYSLALDNEGRILAGGFGAIHRYDGNIWLTTPVDGREITGITLDDTYGVRFTTLNKVYDFSINSKTVPTEAKIIKGDLRLASLPDNLLTFTDEGELYKGYQIYGLDVENKTILNLTDSDSTISDPAWSPSGQELIFRSQPSWSGELYFHKIGQSASTRLTSGRWPPDEGTNWCCAAWSHDGKYVAYVGDGNVFVQDITTGVLERYNLDYQNYFYLAWSPVEYKLAAFQAIDTRILPYYGYSEWLREAPDIRIYDATSHGKEYRAFTSSHAGVNQPFDWSPDGQWLAYVIGGRYSVAYVVIDEVNGNRSYQIPGVSLPDWHPNGETIAYCDGYTVFIQNLNGDTNVSAITFDGEVIALKWSPNGKWLAVVSDRAEYNTKQWYISVLDATKNYEIILEHDLHIDLDNFATRSYVNQIQWRPQ